MIKGTKRQLIVLQTGNSHYFDMAYFVLKSEEGTKNAPTGDLILEANRILSETVPLGKKAKKPRTRRWIFFAAGSLCGAILGILISVFLL